MDRTSGFRVQGLGLLIGLRVVDFDERIWGPALLRPAKD